MNGVYGLGRRGGNSIEKLYQKPYEKKINSITTSTWLGNMQYSKFLGECEYHVENPTATEPPIIYMDVGKALHVSHFGLQADNYWFFSYDSEGNSRRFLPVEYSFDNVVWHSYSTPTVATCMYVDANVENPNSYFWWYIHLPLDRVRARYYRIVPDKELFFSAFGRNSWKIDRIKFGAYHDMVGPGHAHIRYIGDNKDLAEKDTTDSLHCIMSPPMYATPVSTALDAEYFMVAHYDFTSTTIRENWISRMSLVYEKDMDSAICERLKSKISSAARSAIITGGGTANSWDSYTMDQGPSSFSTYGSPVDIPGYGYGGLFFSTSKEHGVFAKSTFTTSKSSYASPTRDSVIYHKHPLAKKPICAFSFSSKHATHPKYEGLTLRYRGADREPMDGDFIFTDNAVGWTYSWQLRKDYGFVALTEDCPYLRYGEFVGTGSNETITIPDAGLARLIILMNATYANADVLFVSNFTVEEQDGFAWGTYTVTDSTYTRSGDEILWIALV